MRNPATLEVPAARAETTPTSAKVDVRDNETTLALCGNQNENLKLMERRLGVRVGQRGTELLLSGPADAVAFAVRLVENLEGMIRAGRPVYREDVEQAIKVLGRGTESLQEVMLGTVLKSSGNRQIAPKSIAQKRYVDAIRNHDIVFGVGPAGTGKTYLAMAMAVAFLQERKVKRIILARPAVEAGEKLGFLPGDLAEKVNPYLRPLYDALHDMMAVERAQALVEQGVVEVAPLAFMRGRTLNDAFVILDEAQNTTVEQMKMFLTRLGYNSKAVITGDVTQVDLPTGKLSGLNHARSVLKNIDGIHFSEFSDVDVVRHPLVQEVIRAYERSEAAQKTAPAAREAASASEGAAPAVERTES
ncbi:PhoH family protein [Corallococcus sp. AB004]|uniref:PhoH family protein n=1 Tax=Corallococcus TaxID=83461 RepID=UPI000EA2BECD|nr:MULTISPECIES: PhoH family protein [Corallococcus]RKI45072.1 PhoH family protein [Corallococcus sp. AB004]NPC70743.1 PhoH family protein [Corallococcus exiguus]NPD25016.1 PhoH family protein [Corallococcus exiguus]NRD43373.1 PhoH family protein [Corallococcus exiguus]RKH93509.1 PhoH family protein [Corallococcus sp. AB038B]